MNNNNDKEDKIITPPKDEENEEDNDDNNDDDDDNNDDEDDANNHRKPPPANLDDDDDDGENLVVVADDDDDDNNTNDDCGNENVMDNNKKDYHKNHNHDIGGGSDDNNTAVPDGGETVTPYKMTRCPSNLPRLVSDHVVVGTLTTAGDNKGQRRRGGGLTKYRQGLKHTLPIRSGRPPKDTLPLETLGFLNYVTFGWLTSHLWAVYRRGAEAVAHLGITATESAETNAVRMEKFWQEELAAKGSEKASFASAIFKSFRTRFWIGSLVNLVGTVLTMANPIFIINHFLLYLTEEEVTLRRGINYIVLLAVFLVLRGLCSCFCWMLHNVAATRIKSGTHAFVYSKILHIKSLRDKSVGDLVNLYSLDGQSLWDGVTNSPLLVGGVLGLVISCGYSFHFLGPWALLAWVVIIGFYPFAGLLAKRSMMFRQQSISISDKRVGLLSELLTSINFVKLYGWEKPLSQKITDLRSQEKKVLEKSVFTMSISMGSAMLVPLFASCLTFIGYVGSGNNLTATQAFTFVSLLNTMQISLATIPFALKSLSDMFVSANRIKEVLLMEEMESPNAATSSSSLVLEMVNACLGWAANKVKDQQETIVNEDTESTKKGGKKKRRRRTKKTTTEDEEKLRQNEEGSSIYTGPVLNKISFTLERGHLLGVCGQIGSGKSTLLNAIMGRMNVLSGSIAVSARVAYVSQQSWITNDTVRDNILFGNDYDEERYKQVIQVCALQPDLDLMPKQDLTEVGERGVTLSGGQKQRISLARAAYSTCDLILLDDPLSALDNHVGKHVFEQCVCDWLKTRSRVFVTHQLQYLKQCDQIAVMQDGRLVENGSHQELLACQGHYSSLQSAYLCDKRASSEMGNMVDSGRRGTGTVPQVDTSHTSDKNHRTIGDGEKVTGNPPPSTTTTTTSYPKDPSAPLLRKSLLGDDDKSKGDDSHQDKELSSLIQKEEMENSLNRWVLRGYIGAMGGFLVMVLVLVCFLVPVTIVTAASWFLSYWINQGAGETYNVTLDHNITLTLASDRLVDNPDLHCYLGVYGCFLPAVLMAMVLRSLATAKAGLAASNCIHNQALATLMQQSLSFFLATPVGRIINRFSTDLNEIDNRLPMHLEIFLMNVLQVVAALAVIAYVSPWFLVPVIPIGVFFWLMVTVFHSCFRHLMCLDNVTRSPVISHLSASVHGLTSIHAYDKSRQFFKKYCALLDTNGVAVFLYYSANRWLALRLDIISALVIFFTGLLILANFDRLTPALAGLGISYAIQISGLFQFTVRLAMETEARFTSVQRLQEYCGIGRDNDGNKRGNKDGNSRRLDITSSSCLTGVTSSTLQPAPSEDWPQHGHVTFSKVTLAYRPSLAPALENVNFEVKAGEKIGIVGRTGAGKSSLYSALFRIFELDRGEIIIDGLDIAKVDTSVLRSRLSVIPQDPVLLTGTVRYNLDPFGQNSDDALWEALRLCHVADLVKALEHQLDSRVEENGANFSIGERQLLCLARVFLKQSRIVVLDEATASIDTETQALIQSALAEAFGGCTMMVISHRLNALLTYDKMLVLEEGKVVEFDTPSNLLANSSSKLTAMLNAAESRERLL